MSTRSRKQVAGGQRGRPREFDINSVSEVVANVFWERGYHATSLDDLCDATGLLRGSLYSAFGDKHGMLLAALEHYGDGAVAQLSARLNSNLPALEALRAALMHYTRTASALNGLRGCFITNATLELLPHDKELARKIELIMRRTATLLTAAVIRGQAEGVFSTDLDEKAVGDFLLCVTQGLRVIGKFMQSEERLAAVVDLSMRALT